MYVGNEWQKGRSKRRITCSTCGKVRPAGSVIYIIADAYYCAKDGKAKVKAMDLAETR